MAIMLRVIPVSQNSVTIGFLDIVKGKGKKRGVEYLPRKEKTALIVVRMPDFGGHQLSRRARFERS